MQKSCLPTGFEPAAFELPIHCSTTWARKDIQMTVTGIFQSPVVKKVIFYFAIVNYFLGSESFLAFIYSDKYKSNLNLNLNVFSHA